MAVDVLSSTTLSAAITKGQTNFQVAATTNITAGDFIVVRGESMKVQAVDDPSSGYIKVLRGVNGTAAWSHPNGERVWIADENELKNARKSMSQFGSGDNAVALVGSAGDLPDYCLPGTRAFDGKGNEYIAVELTATYYNGTTVLLSRDGNFTATVLASGNQGSVAVLVEQGTSDQIVWAQIYGRCNYAQLVGGSSLCSSTGILQPATSVSTPPVGLLGQTTSQASSSGRVPIFGIFPLGTTSTGTTAATSATGFSMPVWLNYPFVTIEPAS